MNGFYFHVYEKENYVDLHFSVYIASIRFKREQISREFCTIVFCIFDPMKMRMIYTICIRYIDSELMLNTLCRFYHFGRNKRLQLFLYANFSKEMFVCNVDKGRETVNSKVSQLFCFKLI